MVHILDVPAPAVQPNSIRGGKLILRGSGLYILMDVHRDLVPELFRLRITTVQVGPFPLEASAVV